jgi:hypothetical protein
LRAPDAASSSAVIASCAGGSSAVCLNPVPSIQPLVRQSRQATGLVISVTVPDFSAKRSTWR